MAIVYWRQELLRHARASYFLQYQSRSAGVGLSGQAQFVAPRRSYWRLQMDLVTQFDGRLMKEFDGFVSAMEGQTNVGQFKVCDPYRYGPSVSPTQQRFSDGTWFSDGTGFIDESATQAMLTAVAASKGAVELTVDLTDPVRPAFRVGDEFSYNYFLYRVTAANGAGLVKFLPRLRTDIPAGAVLVTDPPVVRMRFASDNEGERMRDYLRFGAQITLNFIEAFER